MSSMSNPTKPGPGTMASQASQEAEKARKNPAQLGAWKGAFVIVKK